MFNKLNFQFKKFLRIFHIKWLLNKTITLREIIIRDKIIIIAPHPDDEVIGCGGLISKLVKESNPPYILIMTGGGRSHKSCCKITEKKIIINRRQLTRNALSILGVPSDHLFELNFPDGFIPSSLYDPKFTSEIAKLKEILNQILNFDSPYSNSSLNTQKSSPSPHGAPRGGATIFVPHWGEGWPDHINTSKLIKEIIFSDSSFHIPNLEVFEYCVWLWYYNVFRNLDWKKAFKLKLKSSEHKKKLEAIDAYVTPLAPCGNPWSGVLPKLFLKANQSQSELYFKVK